MQAADPYARTVRQAAHDSVRALLAAPPDSVAGSAALREVITWLGREHGPGAVHDLAEELAVDLAEAFDALAAVEGRDPMTVADEWFHDRPPPPVLVFGTDPGQAVTDSTDPTDAGPPS